MKIVHVSNFTTRRNGVDFWTIPYKLTNGFIRLGHHVVNFCDRDVADSAFLGVRELGRAHANTKLLKICREIRPDFVLLGHCTLIAAKTAAAIRDMLPEVHIAHWNCDPLFYPKNVARLQSLAPFVHATFVTTAGEMLAQLEEAGTRAVFMPNPIDKTIETKRAFENERPQHDLFFISRPDPEKERLARTIQAQIPDLKFDLWGLMGKPQLHGAAMFDVLPRSGMGLNASRRNDVYLYSSDRMSLLVGNGLLTLIDRRTGFDRIFAEDELAFYDGDAELVEKIKRYRMDVASRRAMAERGWRHAHEIFDGTKVAKYIAEVTLGETLSENYGWLEAAGQAAKQPAATVGACAA